jgi:hypothetical protein
MYLKLFESYVRWMESQGRSPDKARLIVAFSLTGAALVNLLSAVLLIQNGGGPKIAYWLAEHSWMTWVVVVVCTAVHVLLSRRIPPAITRSGETATRVWWTSYMVATLVLWCITLGWSLVVMRSARI